MNLKLKTIVFFAIAFCNSVFWQIRDYWNMNITHTFENDNMKMVAIFDFIIIDLVGKSSNLYTTSVLESLKVRKWMEYYA